jgi:hypothetical protein
MTKYNKIYLETGEEEDYEGLNHKKALSVYQRGIIIGLIPIVAAVLITPIFLVLIPLYFAGIKGDINMLMKVFKEVNDDMEKDLSKIN